MYWSAEKEKAIELVKIDVSSFITVQDLTDPMLLKVWTADQCHVEHTDKSITAASPEIRIF